MNLKETLQKYEISLLGFPSDEVLDHLSVDEGKLKALLMEPVFSIKHPLYHAEVGDRRFLPILEEYVPQIQAMIQVRYSKAYTYRECVEKLTASGYTVSSHGQLSNIFNRIETKLGIKDLPRIDSVRTKIRQEAGIPRRVSDDQRTHLKKARKIKEAKDKIARAAKEHKAGMKALAHHGSKVGMTAKELREHRGSAVAHGKGDTRKFDAEGVPIPKVTLDPADIPKDRKVIYEPTDKQAEFHAAGETIVLYGGAAGGGKSYGMLVDALRYCMHEDYRALIIRKSSPMLKELIGVSRLLYPKAFPGAHYNKQESVWYFPSGATIEFGYLDKPEDLERYQGLPYAYIAFDEIQHQRTPDGFDYLMSRLRSANPAITCYMRASANPGGAPWVKEYFIDPGEPGKTFWNKGLSWKFIPARLEDNPHLDTPAEGQTTSAYRKMLLALPETQRKQLLEGDWLAGDNQMFAFNPLIHVISEDPPMHWNRIRGMDYGYRDPAATLWGAVSPYNTIVIYDEHESIETTAAAWSQQVMTKERQDNGDLGIFAPLEEVIDWSLFKIVGNTGPSILEQVRRSGMCPRPADRNREAGWNQIHNRLLMDPVDPMLPPQLLIHSRCVKLIDQIASAQVHPKKPEEIDDSRVTSKGRKHHWDLLDVLRYICMARPSTMSFGDRALKYKQGSMEETWAKFGR